MLWTTRALAALLALASCGATAIAADAPRPHVVFILADDLGSHDVGWRGGEIKTPNLDKLANSGAKLDQFYVQPVCSPTRAALMTGRYPFRYGFQVGVVRPWAEYGLPLEERMLPVALQEVGYETAIVGKWHLGHFRPEYLPTKRGFDHQYGLYNGMIDYYTHVRDGALDWHRQDKASRDEGYTTHLLATEAVERIAKRDKSKPLFLYLPFQAVHGPFQAPEEYSEPYGRFAGNRKNYAGMLAALDEAVGKVVDALRAEDMLANTLIVFSSDNGGPSPGKITDNGPLRAGKGTVYEGGVRTCAFATWEGRIKPGSVVAEPLHIADWYPTILKLAGASLEQPLPIDGKECWDVIAGNPRKVHDEIVLNAAPVRGAIRQGDWKLVVNGALGNELDEGVAPAENAQNGQSVQNAERPANRRELRAAAQEAKADPTLELFNLKDDVSEKNDLAAKHPEKVKELKALYDSFAAQQVPPKTKGKSRGFVTPKVWGESE